MLSEVILHSEYTL